MLNTLKSAHDGPKKSWSVVEDLGKYQTVNDTRGIGIGLVI
jgi:hypothetical protein